MLDFVKEYSPVGDRNTPDDGVKLQAAIDKVYSYGKLGEEVRLGPGWYLTENTINLHGSVSLVGEGYDATQIMCRADADLQVLSMGTDCVNPQLRDLTIFGRMQPGGTAWQGVVEIANNIPYKITRCRIWGGWCAVYTRGTDGEMSDCFISGVDAAAVISNGANWYRRVKMDAAFIPGQFAGYDGCAQAFYQGEADPGTATATKPQENSFVQCDFSGYRDFSIGVTAPAFKGMFLHCVMSEGFWVNNCSSISLVQNRMAKLFHIAGGKLIMGGANEGGAGLHIDNQGATIIGRPDMEDSITW